MRYIVIFIFYYSSLFTIYAQDNPWVSSKDYLSWNESQTLLKVPYSYTAISSLELDKPLLEGKSYEVTILIEGKITKSDDNIYEEYLYDFWLFESNISGTAAKNTKTVTSNVIFPKIRLNDINQYQRAFFTFKVSPKKESPYLTVAIKNNSINKKRIEQYVKLKNMFVSELLQEEAIKENRDTLKRIILPDIIKN